MNWANFLPVRRGMIKTATKQSVTSIKIDVVFVDRPEWGGFI
ncbi:hypothetical protein [Paenibacillus terreus]